ncbi:MAG: hypothetical protein IJ313_02000 [Clostridia bacterium]|nr:hypothetical protein [Clostridia bacterium]
MMKRRCAACFLILLLVRASCAQAGAYGTAWVDGNTADRVHLRAQPSVQAQSLGVFFTGTPVKLDAPEKDGWQAVRIGRLEGFMMRAYLRADAAPGTQVRVGEVHTPSPEGGILLYAEPKADAAVAAQLQDMQAVLVYGQTKEGFFDVGLGNVQRGYVHPSELRLMEPLTQGERRFSESYSLEIGEGVLAEIALEDTGLHFGRQQEGEVCALTIRQGGAAQMFEYISETVPDGAAHLIFDDVNMDGYQDILALRTMGASDAYAVWFLYRPQTGAFARCDALGGFSAWRYALDPEEKTIVNNRRISAGEVRWEKYRWKGETLVLEESGVTIE